MSSASSASQPVRISALAAARLAQQNTPTADRSEPMPEYELSEITRFEPPEAPGLDERYGTNNHRYGGVSANGLGYYDPSVDPEDRETYFYTPEPIIHPPYEIVISEPEYGEMKFTGEKGDCSVCYDSGDLIYDICACSRGMPICQTCLNDLVTRGVGGRMNVCHGARCVVDYARLNARLRGVRRSGKKERVTTIFRITQAQVAKYHRERDTLQAMRVYRDNFEGVICRFYDPYEHNDDEIQYEPAPLFYYWDSPVACCLSLQDRTAFGVLNTLVYDLLNDVLTTDEHPFTPSRFETMRLRGHFMITDTDGTPFALPIDLENILVSYRVVFRDEEQRRYRVFDFSLCPIDELENDAFHHFTENLTSLDLQYWYFLLDDNVKAQFTFDDVELIMGDDDDLETEEEREENEERRETIRDGISSDVTQLRAAFNNYKHNNGNAVYMYGAPFWNNQRVVQVSTIEAGHVALVAEEQEF